MVKTVKTTDKRPVAIYARVSTQEQAEEGTSLDFQHEQLTGYCRSQGWEVFREYVDRGYSGKDGDRPELKRLMSDAKLGLFGKVVVYKLDRLARKLRLLLELEENLKEHDVSLVSMKDSIDTSTAMGRTVFQMLGLVAEWERETIVERTKSGRLQRYKQGCWAGGKPLYGYQYNKDTKKLEIDKSKVPTIRRIFQEYATGKSLVQITNGLNRDGIPARRSRTKCWDPSAVRDIVFNPAYKGQQVVNHYQHIANVYRVDMSKAMTIKIPPVVSEALWEKAKRHRNDNKHVRLHQRGESWPLQGLVTCGLCGHSYAVHAYQYQHKKNRVYFCRGRLQVSHRDGTPRCTCPNLPAGCLEAKVWQRIEAIINDPDKLEIMLEGTVDRLRSREDEISAQIRPLDGQLSTIAEQKRRMADDWVRLNMDPDKYRKLQQELDQEESRLKGIRAEIDPKQLEELERTRSLLKFWESQLRAMKWNLSDEEGRTVRTVDQPHKNVLKILGFEDKDISKAMEFPATQREVLDQLGVRLVVFPDRVEVKAVFDVAPLAIPLCTSTSGGTTS
jgi:site-specific DNA recombinase